MPHRRKPERGSFRDHLDGLVAQFPDEEARRREAAEEEKRRKHKAHINELLFDRAARD